MVFNDKFFNITIFPLFDVFINQFEVPEILDDLNNIEFLRHSLPTLLILSPKLVFFRECELVDQTKELISDKQS